MKRTLSLDDARLFLAVADAGGLAGASRTTGVSVPTIGRRMAQLENDTGLHLFKRGKRGYTLTTGGRSFAAEAEQLRAAHAQLAAFIETQDRPASVRITAGTWTARFLARELPKVWSVDAGWVPEFLAANANLDIARREADIGIRNRRPEQAWLAGKCTGDVSFAVYAKSLDVKGFIALSSASYETPSQVWLRAHHGDEIVTTANDPRLALDLAEAGMGKIVMPTFAGDAEPNVTRIGTPIEELTHEEWLVSHHDGRHDPPVRAALDAISAILLAAKKRRKAETGV